MFNFGDVVYDVVPPYPVITEYTIKCVRCNENGEYFYDAYNASGEWLGFRDDAIGTNVFLTRSDAENEVRKYA